MEPGDGEQTCRLHRFTILLPDDRFDVGADTGTPVDEEDDLVPAPPDRETRRVGSYSA
jgi:hypothetical protein